MNLEELTRLLEILEQKQIAEFELEEPNRKLRIRKAAAPVVPAPAAAPANPPAAGAAVARPTAGSTVEDAVQTPVPEPAPAEEGLVVVKSPIVGTFYRSPDPNAPAFVNVGDHVKVGQVLCIIEAMKLMNEIEAETAGEIVQVHPENGQPVQYGEALFSLRPSR